MASITQRIPNFLGGVSRQPDDKKLPGQVRECINSYPDPTFGLTKRPGTKFIAKISETENGLSDAKWFYINRDATERYIGCVRNTEIKVWNANTGVECTVTYQSGSAAYLTGTRSNYHVLTVQDTTFITNNLFTVAARSAAASESGKSATLRLYEASYSSEYKVSIKVGSTTYSITPYITINADSNIGANDPPKKVLAIDTVLTELASRINGLGIPGMTVTQLKGTLELNCTSAFSIVEASGGVSGEELKGFSDTVQNISELPSETSHNRIVQVINTVSREDTYYAKFIAENGVSGKGYWEETVSPNVSPGLDASTMPHELINSGLNTFVFRPAVWEDRLVGDDVSNQHPSFVGKTIQQAFFHANRLGFLTEDNVSMSQIGEYYNFYHISALTQTQADPIDLSCSSLKPAVITAVVPVAQGLALFTKNQQFLMLGVDGILTPTTTSIRPLSAYECDVDVDPVDVGTNLVFISKTPGYSRVYGMLTRGQSENPDVVDIGRIVSEWIPDTIDNLIASPQNSFVAMSGATTPYIYFFRTYGGDEDGMQSWFNWKLPGNVQYCVADSDDFYVVTYQSGQYCLVKTNLNQTPDEQILVTNEGNVVQICMDLYTNPSSVVYDSVNDVTKCYLPYADIPALEPVLIIAGTVQVASVYESGFTITPDRDSDGTGPYFSVAGKDLSGQASEIYVGYKYNFDVELPKLYYQVREGESDYTAYLNIARMKFSVGLSSNVGFKIKPQGSSEWYDVQSVQDADYYLANDVPLQSETIFTVPVHQRNNNYSFRVFSDSPFPVALTSMMWEGTYSPRFYRRT